MRESPVFFTFQSKPFTMKKLISALLSAAILALPLAAISTSVEAKPMKTKKHAKGAHAAKKSKKVNAGGGVQ
jgi:Ni/Co efflux regulator RcnB